MTEEAKGHLAAGWGLGLIGLVAVALTSGLVLRTLSQVDWDPTIYTAFGEEATPTRIYAEERLGEVFLRPLQGHDGKFFFVQANDPLVLDPESNAMVLDRPLYRSQRMLYPLIAGGAGLFTPGVIVWAMIVVNVLAMGAGTMATSLVARAMGMSPWWGLAFVLNLGFISELNISGAGIVAAAAAFGAVAAYLGGRRAVGVALLCLAALSREAMVIAAVGTAIWLWHFQGRRRDGTAALIVPLAAVGAWALYLRAQMGMESGVAQVQEIGLPFVGFFQALRSWTSDPFDLAVGITIMALFALYTKRVLRSGHLVGWAFVGFVLLGLMFTRQVWLSYFDITRAIAPIITAYVLMLFAPTSAGPATWSVAEQEADLHTS